MYEMARTGPDIICSMDEEACGELLQAAKEVSLMRGGTKGALPEEQVTIDFAFATVVTIAPVKKRRGVYQRKYLGQTAGNR